MKNKLQNLRALAAQNVARLGVAAGTAMMAVSSHAAGMDALFDEVDMGSTATKITALAVVIVGIALVIKGPAVVKRIIAKI
ncbi:hypothetical protein [Comamonas sp.]|uniref:hypothetical protein n=1 Tax=Comamonas sp. TaxID=34028 RepID=UPI0028AC8CD2|nr:hypothetical protein [Comamonas sp.]